MKTLVIGSGGREHAIAWKLSQSPKVTEVYCAPGNPGMKGVAECVDIKVDDLDGLVNFAKEHEIDLTVVGPEYPLTLGVVDHFKAAGLRVFGPSKEAAQLEGSKSFAKDVMIKAGVPTAEHRTFTTPQDALAHVRLKGAPVVLKADGLAAGKGVIVCHELAEAEAAVEELFEKFGSERVVVETFLEGREVSYIVATDGKNVVPFASSHDYKRIGENDAGPNTGGMGSVSPTPRLTPEQETWVLDNVIRPVIEQMAADDSPFAGFLYAGLMIDSDEQIRVLEFNTRLGDPEAQAILRRMQSDLFELLYALSEDQPAASIAEQDWSNETAVCVVLASEGYPTSPTKGDEIDGLDQAGDLPDSVVFHAGTSLNDGKRFITSGGRVLNVTATGPNLEEARGKTYKAADMVQFRGRQLRRDIGDQCS